MKKGSKADEIMTLAFLLLVIVAGICAFAIGKESFMIISSVAVGVRLIQYVLRFFGK